MALYRGDAHSALMHIELAEYHGARLLQSVHHRGIVRRDAISKHRAPRGGLDPSRVDEIFQGDGDPVERPAPLPALSLSFQFTRPCEGVVSSNGDIGIENWIQFLDPREARLRQLDRRDGLSANTIGRLLQAQPGEIPRSPEGCSATDQQGTAGRP